MKLTYGAGSADGDYVTVRFVSQDERATQVPDIPEAEFSGKPGAALFLREKKAFFVGLGDRARLDARRFRRASGTAVMSLRKIGRKNIALDLEGWSEFVDPAVDGAILADYRFEEFKKKRSEGLKSLRVLVGAKELPIARKEGERSRKIAEATNLCRSIANLPGNVLYPETLATRAAEIAKDHGLKCTLLKERQLEQCGFGGILAVGAGSARGPRLIVLEHCGGAKGERPIALIGKAVTFDSGGISIKPAANMEEMVFDKCGGMAILGAMAAIAALKLKRNVVGIIPSAENLPSSTACRPGDIIQAYDGTQIEVINTDAEGRVILGDAIAYARTDLNASAIIDLATLTGACGVALGEYAAGLWANHDAWKQAVLEASVRAGERLWPMPLFSEYEDQIKSEVAVIKNSGGRLGGACTGAAFLKHFAGDVPWAHLDIAYTSHRNKDQAHIARGANGFGVRTLVELVERWEA